MLGTSLTDKFIISALKKAAGYALSHFSLTGQKGKMFDLGTINKKAKEMVSDIDLKVQDLLIASLIEHCRSENIFSEELNNFSELQGNKSSYKIIMDPLDGTHNFLYGLPNWGLSLALLNTENDPQYSFIYLPVYDLMIFSGEEKKTFVVEGDKKKECIPSELTELKRAMVAFDNQFYKLPEGAFNTFQDLAKRCFTTRILGCSSYDTAMIVLGHLESRVWFNCEAYDIAPAFPILKNSGAHLLNHDFKQARNIFSKRFIGIANSSLAVEMSHSIKFLESKNSDDCYHT